MAFSFGVGPHPQTGKAMLVIQAAPEEMPRENMLNVLRMIKKFFPEEFKLVGRELILPVNGHPGLEIPDDISKKPDGP